jgi:hypothetical protein
MFRGFSPSKIVFLFLWHRGKNRLLRRLFVLQIYQLIRREGGARGVKSDDGQGVKSQKGYAVHIIFLKSFYIKQPTYLESFMVKKLHDRTLTLGHLYVILYSVQLYGFSPAPMGAGENGRGGKLLKACSTEH